MTVKEMFENKYREKMATITEREWNRAKENAEYKKMHVAEYIMRCLEITEKDFYNNGIYYNGGELEALNKQKLIASNRNKAGFERNHITVYWLTEKGYKKLFA
jgi:predicted Zn-dependent protease